MNKLSYLLFLFVCWSCTHDTGTEKHQNKRNNIVHVREKMKEIITDDVLINAYASVYMADKYLIVKDQKSFDGTVHIFDKNSFRYISSAIPRGQGPDEMTVPGPIVFDNLNHKLYYTDMGKYKIFSYDLDSLLASPLYKPNVRMDMNEKKVSGWYHYINDTLCIGAILESVGNSDFKQSVARWNMNTGEIVFMEYEHPGVKDEKHFSLAVSPEHGIYAVCYHHHDLITVCSFDGNLKYNIYGPKWNGNESSEISCFSSAFFCGDKLFAAYNGENTFVDRGKGMETSRPTRLIVFDINGNYLRTLETEYSIWDYSCDRENNRIILSLDDEIQFACLELDGLI